MNSSGLPSLLAGSLKLTFQTQPLPWREERSVESSPQSDNNWCHFASSTSHTAGNCILSPSCLKRPFWFGTYSESGGIFSVHGWSPLPQHITVFKEESWTPEDPASSRPSSATQHRSAVLAPVSWGPLCVDPTLPPSHLSLMSYHPLEKYGLGFLSPQIPQTFQGLLYGLTWVSWNFTYWNLNPHISEYDPIYIWGCWRCTWVRWANIRVGEP